MNTKVLAVLAGAALWALPAAGSDIIIGNYNTGTAIGTVFGDNTSSIFKAAGFRMPAEDFELEKVTMSLDFDFGGAGGQARVSIWTGETFPDQELVELVGPPVQAGIGDFDFTPPSRLVLEADTVYWVYIDAVLPGSFRWHGTSPSTAPSGLAQHIVYIWNSNPSSTLNRFEVRGTRAGTGCYPDCDGNGTLDFFDFLCFQNAFLAQDPYADCDGNGVLDFFDFLCFQNEFLAGCP